MNLLWNILNFLNNYFHSRTSQTPDSKVNLWFFAELNLSQWTKTQNFAKLVPNASASCTFELSRIVDFFARRSLMSHEYCTYIALPSHACLLFNRNCFCLKILETNFFILEMKLSVKACLGFNRFLSCPWSHQALKWVSRDLALPWILLAKTEILPQFTCTNIKTMTALK